MKTKPNFYIFHKEIRRYFSSLKGMEKKNAVELCSSVEEQNLAENSSSLVLISFSLFFCTLVISFYSLFYMGLDEVCLLPT